LPTVLLGISGSISAYKSLDVIRLLRRESVQVLPVLSASANRFVTPWSVETLAESPLISDSVLDGRIHHLSALNDANVFAICPASANTIARLANGLCDDLLGAAWLGYTGPKVLFPAMHTAMYTNPITQTNIAHLRASGVTVIDPDSGPLASGDIGLGRLPEPASIAPIIHAHALAPLSLRGQRITITTGGTRERIDPVRSITNHATGKSGHILAIIAASFGATVTLIRAAKGPTIAGITSIDCESAQEMHDACMAQSDSTDVLIMNAAVSDYTIPYHPQKLPRHAAPSLSLSSTPDILAAFRKKAPATTRCVGYCLSDADDLIACAIQKKNQKGCDIMIANAPSDLGQDQRQVIVIDASNTPHPLSGSLTDISVGILRHIYGASTMDSGNP
jgi:phosphopantothenoylcysteine decarboxylase/phosphopantothenate--cysteine ligase